MACVLVYGEMHLAPDPPLGDTMLTRFPLTVAKDLQARAIHHQMEWLR